MKIILDDEGYVSSIVSEDDSSSDIIEIPDNTIINFKYLHCYKLNDEGTGLVMDAQRIKKTEEEYDRDSKIRSLKKQLNDSDYKVLRRLREFTLGIAQTLSEQEYLELEAQRESIVRKIRELETNECVSTSIDAILEEGKDTRETENDVIEKNSEKEEI